MPQHPPIKIQRQDSELTVQFQLDDLDSYFARSASSSNLSRYTDYFGPGLRFGSYSFVSENGPRHLGLYLYTSKEYPALTISWTVSARSLTGQLFYNKAMSYSFKCGEAIGWSKFLNTDTLQGNRTMKEENTLVIHAVLRFAPLWPVINRPTLDTIHHVVVGKETPSNIRYIAYTHRSGVGRLSRPRALFAAHNALVEQASGNDFSQSDELPQISGVLLGTSEQPQQHVLSHYCEDDSDFEEDLDGAEDDVEMPQEAPKDRASNTRVRLIDRIHDTTSEAASVKPEPADTQLAELPESPGRTVVVLGAAACTWEAVLYWLYTGVIAFAPLTSDGKEERQSFIEEHSSANPNRPIPVSCKSVYRIADALKLEPLKKRALQHLEYSLSMRTYLHELFSEFTSKYDEVKRMELVAVVKHWDVLKGSTALRSKMIDIASGKLPHAGPIMADLLMKASVKEELKEGVSVSQGVHESRSRSR